MAKKYKNFEEARAAIIAHAWKNPEFKAKLLKNPRAAFKEMGVELPDETEVRVVEDKVGTLTFVLPRAVSNVREMSDADLKKLAGGACMQAQDSRVTVMVEVMSHAQLEAGANMSQCNRQLGSSRSG